MATEHCTHRWRPRGGRGRDRHGVSSGRIWSLHASLLSAPDSCALTARAAVGWIALESSAWRSGRGAGSNGSGNGELLGHLGRTQVRFTAGVEGVPVTGDEAAEEGGRETPSPDFDFSLQRSIQREPIDSLDELGFVERRENLVLRGPPGVGPTSRALRGANVQDPDPSGTPGGGGDRHP